MELKGKAGASRLSRYLLMACWMATSMSSSAAGISARYLSDALVTSDSKHRDFAGAYLQGVVEAEKERFAADALVAKDLGIQFYAECKKVLYEGTLTTKQLTIMVAADALVHQWPEDKPATEVIHQLLLKECDSMLSRSAEGEK